MNEVSWGASQSFFQLGIAIDVTLGALALFGREPAKESQLLLTMLEEVTTRLGEDNSPLSDLPGVPVELSIQSLINVCDRISKASDRFISGIMRSCCILGCLAGYVGLTLSTIHYGDPISATGVTLLVGSNLPFFIGLYWALKSSWEVRSKVSMQRRTLQNLLEEPVEEG